ncbi:zf-HC2 domain-containing protein [Gordonia tangerina]|uniref:Zf-HC2 domain-containing protein n=1 Tax=Gordonia tangerina TaxID=2911060 RepID=A0ABS9DIF4_9ACTN|nr:zf-HC2 domain-containing protein [Gordonia tangerina]MCF3938816.1 zf-HC2 domain-containing protein [Gordonia tangerina]
MRCEVAREALSARLDGEYEGVPSERVDEHVAQCPGCRSWLVAATRHSDAMAGLELDEPPQTPPTLLDSAGTPPVTRAARVQRGLRSNAIRIGLTLTGAAQIVIAMLQMTGIDFGMTHGAPDASTHLVNETTAWALALGVCMIVAAWWQRALPGLLVVLSVFTVVLIGYVIHDALAGAVTVSRVLSHLPVVIGLGFAVWGSRGDPSGAQSERFDLDRWSSGRPGPRA